MTQWVNIHSVFVCCSSVHVDLESVLLGFEQYVKDHVCPHADLGSWTQTTILSTWFWNTKPNAAKNQTEASRWQEKTRGSISNKKGYYEEDDRRRWNPVDHLNTWTHRYSTDRIIIKMFKQTNLMVTAPSSWLRCGNQLKLDPYRFAYSRDKERKMQLV